jgi:hypothetical protein
VTRTESRLCGDLYNVKRCRDWIGLNQLDKDFSDGSNFRI